MTLSVCGAHSAKNIAFKFLRAHFGLCGHEYDSNKTCNNVFLQSSPPSPTRELRGTRRLPKHGRRCEYGRAHMNMRHVRSLSHLQRRPCFGSRFVLRCPVQKEERNSLMEQVIRTKFDLIQPSGVQNVSRMSQSCVPSSTPCEATHWRTINALYLSKIERRSYDAAHLTRARRINNTRRVERHGKTPEIVLQYSTTVQY
jgi:hypothetical protein